MVITHSIPAPAPAQDSISRDFTQKHTSDPAVRRMTVCNSLRDIRGPNERPMRAPQLLLRGAWLQRAGFHAGVPVKVHVSCGRLVIEPDHDRASPAEVLATLARVADEGLPRRELNALRRFLQRQRRRD
jgi:Toxin SymE, type I toxin-antitoxin system